MRWNREAAEAVLRDLPPGSLLIDTYTPLDALGRQSFFSTWITDQGELQGQVSHTVVGEAVARWRQNHVGVAVIVDDVRLDDLNCRTCSRPMRVVAPGAFLQDEHDCGGECCACVHAAEAAECPA